MLVVCICDDWGSVRADEVALTVHKPVKGVIYHVRADFMFDGNRYFKLVEIVNPPVYNHFLKSVGEPSFDARIFREVLFSEALEKSA